MGFWRSNQTTLAHAPVPRVDGEAVARRTASVVVVDSVPCIIPSRLFSFGDFDLIYSNYSLSRWCGPDTRRESTWPLSVLYTAISTERNRQSDRQSRWQWKGMHLKLLRPAPTMMLMIPSGCAPPPPQQLQSLHWAWAPLQLREMVAVTLGLGGSSTNTRKLRLGEIYLGVPKIRLIIAAHKSHPDKQGKRRWAKQSSARDRVGDHVDCEWQFSWLSCLQSN